MSARGFDSIRRRRLAVAAVCIAAAIAGCGDKETGPITIDPPDFLPRTSPLNLLNNLALAYGRRDLAQYDSLLAADFTFVTATQDRRWWPDLPEQWGRDSEVLIHARLFDAQAVPTLTLQFVTGAIEWDAMAQMPADSIHGVRLYLIGSVPARPNDPKEYRLDFGRGKLWFRRNGWFWPGTQDSVWTIVRWQDYPEFVLPVRGAASDVPTGWGVIKHFFLP
jgi:hypothetical protein